MVKERIGEEREGMKGSGEEREGSGQEEDRNQSGTEVRRGTRQTIRDSIKPS